ncbi:adenylate/guanylate cyclase domain-containing protein [Mesorhizobium sp. L-8-3]|uniref:adenylate/guanylate cyclase domain-containing protein n=1 Tax=Mesorhizobium sp. L-8-3 TaxID=2744522 RepID=UPI0019296CE7|nr:adenylate/guanylate cyclase domain-containing protein [Mesorhizobium sp. L-8-3]BCH24572.1 adenylate/guanylate cyclase domain-containing protein [Mesorhizobium sp. L-8-3]
MRVRVSVAISVFLLCCIAVSAIAVDALWRRTADSNSRLLVATLDHQITETVRNEVAGRIASAEAAFGAVRTIFLQNVIKTREADKREFVFLSQLQAQPSLSWVAFGWPDSTFFASHKLGDGELEMMEIYLKDGAWTRRVDRYKVVPGDIEFYQRNFEPTDYFVTDHAWYQQAIKADAPAWFIITEHPVATRAAAAFAGPIDVYYKRQGVLATIVEIDRLSRFLGSLSVARTGAAFILSSGGDIVAGPDGAADEVHGADLGGHPLFGIARELGQRLASGAAASEAIRVRIVDQGVSYNVTATPLDFLDWHVAVIIPEAEFLAEIDRTTARLAFTLLALVLAAGGVSVLIAQRLLAEPLRAVAEDLRAVENFQLDQISRRRSWLVEFDKLSTALVHMATGLSAFAKYIPTDLVRTLVTEGMEARPGGEMRPLTILFADVAGFTGMSERLGKDIVPVISGYLDLASQAIEAEAGTIDKFIGDAVMAFWGAPRRRNDHATAACRAALRISRALRDTGPRDDAGNALTVRIGLNSGVALVGNIGSATHLNYTAVGDAVNVASRLEIANKLYGTSIIMGEEARKAAGADIIVRELDRIAVYGREGGIAIFELIAMAGEERPSWIGSYESGLHFYRTRRWRDAESKFEDTVAARGDDPPSRWMIARCRLLQRQDPDDDWQPITVMESK